MLSARLLSLTLLLATAIAPVGAHANITEWIWGTLERAFGLQQVVVEPRDVTGADGRTYPWERQVMITLQAGELSGDPARADLFTLVSHWLNVGYRGRPLIPLQAANGVGFSRAWDIVRNEFATRHRDSTVTQFALLVDQEIEVVESAGGFVARLAIEQDSFEIPVHRDIHGDWQVDDGATGEGNLFAELRGRFARGAQALVFMQDARPLFGRDLRLTERAAHEFYGKLLGLQDAELYVGRPLAGPFSQLAITQLARRGISRLLVGGISLAIAAYYAPDAGDLVVTALIAGGLYLTEGLVQRNAGRGHLSTFEQGSLVSYEFALDHAARKRLQLAALACGGLLVPRKR